MVVNINIELFFKVRYLLITIAQHCHRSVFNTFTFNSIMETFMHKNLLHFLFYQRCASADDNVSIIIVSKIIFLQIILVAASIKSSISYECLHLMVVKRETVLLRCIKK